LKYCGNERALTLKAVPVTSSPGTLPFLIRIEWDIMRVQGGHWLDYDPIALAALLFGIGTVLLVALNI
jgi:hypothetical protein